MSEPAIAVEDLTCHYEQRPAIWDVSFEIPRGKVVGIIGPNGAGKSTLLKALLGIVRPSSGSISFGGRPYREVRRKIAYVPQREAIDWDFPITVLGVVLMGRYGHFGLLRRIRKADRMAAMESLEMVGMAPFADRPIGELSGGQQQRTFFARALFQEADLLLLDEPFAGIDLATEGVLAALLRELRDAGKTILVVHHDLYTASRIFDWALLLNLRLIAAGPLKEVFTLPLIEQTFGKSHTLLEEALFLSKARQEGLS
ncbi:MAG: metal ABC transporter ATP-binding protein [Parachlamydiales bacterium]